VAEVILFFYVIHFLLWKLNKKPSCR